MKNLLKYIGVLVVPVCCFWSCSNSDEPIVESVDPSIELLDNTAKSYTIEAKGGTLNVKFTATEDWTAMSNSEWCKISESAGEGGTVTLPLTVEPNEDFEGREAVITLRLSKHSSKKEQFLVKQTERGAVLVSMKHTNVDFVLPSFLGDKLSGTIQWGDGQEEDLQNEASHSYSEEKEYTVTVELKGANKVTWKDLVGLTEIDLSAF